MLGIVRNIPKKLFDDIAQKFILDGKGKLLDLGCGTGEMAIPLATYFEKVLALDPDKEMLVQGLQKAKKLKIDNIIWQKSSSKTLSRLNKDFRLVTMGQSFHWMDAENVLNELYKIIQPYGGVVIWRGCDSWSNPTAQDKLTTRKSEIVEDLTLKTSPK